MKLLCCQRTTFSAYNPNVEQQQITFSTYFNPFNRPNQWKLLFESNLPSSAYMFKSTYRYTYSYTYMYTYTYWTVYKVSNGLIPIISIIMLTIDSINPLVKIFSFLIDSIDHQPKIFFSSDYHWSNWYFLESIDYPYQSSQCFLAISAHLWHLQSRLSYGRS